MKNYCIFSSIVFIMFVGYITSFSSNNKQENIYQIIRIDTSKYYYYYILAFDLRKDTILILSQKECFNVDNTLIKTDSTYLFKLSYLTEYNYLIGDNKTKARYHEIQTKLDNGKSYTLYETSCLCGLRYIGCK
jgi:hypothetical protein